MPRSNTATPALPDASALDALPAPALAAFVVHLAALQAHASARLVETLTKPPARPVPMPDHLLTPDELASRLNLPRRFVVAHWSDFGGVKIGRRVRFPERAARAAIEAQRAAR